MEPLPIQILLFTDRAPGTSIVERAITDAISTSLTLCHPQQVPNLLADNTLVGFNLICVEDSYGVDAVEVLLQLKPRERRLWTIVVVPTLGNTTRIRELFRYGAADVLLPEEVGRETLRDTAALDDRHAPPSMKGPAALFIREIVEHINGGFCTIGVDGTIGYCSARFCEMLGCDESFLEGRRFLATIESGEVAQRGWDSIEDLPPHPFETELVRVDGAVLPVLISCFRLNAGDELPRAICIISDLSEIKSAQVQMQRSRRELQKKDALIGSLLKNIPQVAIAAFDAGARIEVISDGATHIFGRTAEALRGTSFHELFEHLEQDSTTEELLQEISQRAVAFSFLAPRNGDRLPCRAVMGPRFEEGVLTGYVAVCFDQKNERDLQERLIQRERLSAIGELVAGVAHDLNNPLAGIAGFCEILQSHQTSGDKLQQYLSIISTQTDRCKHIVENLLSFVRPKAGEHQSVVDVNGLLDKIAELRSYHLNKHHIRLIKHYQQPLPQTTGDYYRLQQVFYNLIHNAEQALRELDQSPREIELETSFEGGWYTIAVTDSGPGVPDRIKQRIFDSFFSTKGPGKGTGLGLSIAAAVVAEHRGTLSVEDGPSGRGARFVVRFPQAGVAKQSPAPPQSSAPMLSGKKVLVIDDEPTIVSFFTEYVSSIGGSIDSAATVAEAFPKIAAGEHDLVICDHRLPDGTGIDLFVQRVAVEPDFARRFLLTTGVIPDGKALTLTELHAIHVLQKPFTLDELNTAVAAALR